VSAAQTFMISSIGAFMYLCTERCISLDPIPCLPMPYGWTDPCSSVRYPCVHALLYWPLSPYPSVSWVTPCLSHTCCPACAQGIAAGRHTCLHHNAQHARHAACTL